MPSYKLNSRTDPGEGDCPNRPPSPKTYEINFIHHDFVEFGKQRSWF